MIAPLSRSALLGLVIFYVQNLVFFPHVHLRLLSLLLFYVGLRPSLALALALALVLGGLQDSLRHHPLRAPSGRGPGAGGRGPVFPATAALAAPRFPGGGQSGGPELCKRSSCRSAPSDPGIRRLFSSIDLLTTVHLMEILGTAALGPLMYLLVQGVENFLRRFGWRPSSEPSPYQPFS